MGERTALKESRVRVLSVNPGKPRCRGCGSRPNSQESSLGFDNGRPPSGAVHMQGSCCGAGSLPSWKRARPLLGDPRGAVRGSGLLVDTKMPLDRSAVSYESLKPIPRNETDERTIQGE